MGSLEVSKRGRFFSSFMALNAGFFILVLFGVAFNLGFPTAGDKASYRALMANAENDKQGPQRAPYKAKQEREGILKEITYNEGPNRLNMRLSAKRAELVLDHQAEEGTEIIEKMQQVACYMQEELFYILPDGREVVEKEAGKLVPRGKKNEEASVVFSKNTQGLKAMQIVRHMEADTASYYYKTDRFVADHVRIKRYLVPGHELKVALKDSKLIMEGIASHVEFFLSGQMNFKASNLKASMRGLR